MKEFLNHADNSQLQLLKIEDASLLIRKENQEIVYAGRRYDVKEEFSNDGVVYFYCVNDKKEEDLFVALQTSVNNQSVTQKGKHNERTIKLFNQIIKDYYLKDEIVNIPDAVLAKKTISFYSVFHFINFLSVVTPPPKGIVC